MTVILYDNFILAKLNEESITNILEKEGYINGLSLIKENNVVHINETIWDHIEDTHSKFKIILTKSFESSHPCQKIGGFSRFKLLQLSVLFHDLGKRGYGQRKYGKTIRNIDESTNSKNHEHASLKIFLDLNSKHNIFIHSECINYLSLVIRLHGGFDNKSLERIILSNSFTKFVKEGINFELLLYQLVENSSLEPFYRYFMKLMRISWHKELEIPKIIKMNNLDLRKILDSDDNNERILNKLKNYL